MEHHAAYAAGPNRSSVTHGIGRVTDIPDQPYDLYICRCLDHHNNVSLDTEQRTANELAFAQVHVARRASRVVYKNTTIYYIRVFTLQSITE